MAGEEVSTTVLVPDLAQQQRHCQTIYDTGAHLLESLSVQEDTDSFAVQTQIDCYVLPQWRQCLVRSFCGLHSTQRWLFCMSLK